jgi:hypothetical protein
VAAVGLALQYAGPGGPSAVPGLEKVAVVIGLLIGGIAFVFVYYFML